MNKKLAILTLLVVAVIFLSVFQFSFAQEMKNTGNQKKIHEVDDWRHRIWEMNKLKNNPMTKMKGLMSSLNLSQEQMIELQKISLSYQKEKLELKNKIQLRQLELKGLLLDEELDLIKIRSEFQKIADLEAEMKMGGLKAYLTAKEILTPEQQEKLPINFPLTMPNFGRFNRVPHMNKSFN
jgi:Spy/CpxP family protein refolding chaperone